MVVLYPGVLSPVARSFLELLYKLFNAKRLVLL